MNPYEQIFSEIATGLLEVAEIKPNYSDNAMLDVLLIFQSVLMDKVFDNQNFDNMPMEQRMEMVEGAGKELRKLITSDREKFKKKFKPFLNKYFQNNLTQASEYLNLDRGRIQSIFRRSGEPLLTDRRRLSEAKPGGIDVAQFNIDIATDQNFKENLIICVFFLASVLRVLGA